MQRCKGAKVQRCKGAKVLLCVVSLACFACGNITHGAFTGVVEISDDQSTVTPGVDIGGVLEKVLLTYQPSEIGKTPEDKEVMAGYILTSSDLPTVFDLEGGKYLAGWQDESGKDVKIGMPVTSDLRLNPVILPLVTSNISGAADKIKESTESIVALSINDSTASNSSLAVLAQALKDNPSKTVVLDLSSMNGLTSVGDGMFRDSANLVSVSLPGATENNTGSFTIQSNAFAGCTALETIFIPPTITAIENNAFQDCVSLVEVSGAANVSDWGTSVFAGCSSLSIVSDKAVSSALSAAEESKNLKILGVPDVSVLREAIIGNPSVEVSLDLSGVDSVVIPQDGFKDCSNLKSLKLPSRDVTEISPSAFAGLSNLSLINEDGNIIANADKVYFIPSTFKDTLDQTTGISVWTRKDNASQPDDLGKNYSVLLGSRPYEADLWGDKSPYASVGGENSGSFRIPSITKTVVNGRTRLVCAFDVRYRGSHKGDGDVGQGTCGSDITVLYSDDGGATWTPARNRNTGKKPAIDVSNTYNEKGQQDTIGRTNTPDVCDPQLTVMPDGTIYCGMAAGGGNMAANPNFRVWKSTDNGETWEEDAMSNGNLDVQNTFFQKWGKEIGTKFFKTVLTTPGHGIILSKDVPGNSVFKAGQAVMPVFLNGNPSATSGYGMYLATGLGSDLSAWDTSNFTPTYTRWKNTNSEESQVCQLDDGSLLLYGKSGSDQFSRFTGTAWTHLTNTISNGKNCQAGLLKVADGDGITKRGVVAFSYSGNQAGNADSLAQGSGRGNITICLAADISTSTSGETFPLDESEPYYLKIRTQSQSYFGYTDLVMIDENTLGIIYENYSSDTKVHGMRFARIDISQIIKELSRID